MPQKFSGIHEKLKRADQNIRNLDRELRRFIKSGRYPVVPEHNRERLLKALKYHRRRRIPPRFAVLAGEIIHHLRSCLDHLVWEFSSIQYRNDHPRWIEFPVCGEKPIKKDEIRLFERKIKGIANSKAIDWIERLQPYNATDPANTFLFVLHHFDITDKHRELLVVGSAGSRKVSVTQSMAIDAYKSAHPEMSPGQIAFKFKGYGKIVPQVSFRNFGRRPLQPVVPGLTELRDATVSVAAEFAKLL
jgi:hypothetical protein